MPWNWPPSVWLGLLVTTYFGVSLDLSYLRWIELSTSNFDLGIFMQALWSSNHGLGFYASGNFTWNGAPSLLRLHPAGALYALAPVYGLDPSPVTLFAIQSGLIASAAVPLYLLGQDVTRKARYGLVAAALYLAWTPLLAANLFDFHLECFLPLEYLCLFWLWHRRRYALGLALAALSFATFEAAPALVLLIGLFFLAGFAVRGRPFPPSAAVMAGPDGTSWRARLRQPGVGPSVVLVFAAVVAELALLAWQSTFPSSFPGAATFITIGSNFAQGPPALPVSVSYLGDDFFRRLAYWLVLFSLVGFLPFWAPRTLLLSGPWVVATLVSVPHFTDFGSPHALVVVGPLLAGSVYGMGTLLRRPTASPEPPVPELRVWTGRRVWQRFARTRRLDWALVGLLAINLLGSPVNPWTHYGTAGNGYEFSYSVPPGYEGVMRLVGLLPQGAQVLASDNLFPLVANDVNSYGLYYQQYSPPLLPFNGSRPPDYLLLSESELNVAPPWVAELLSTPGAYGLLGSATATPAGIVLLYERHYAGGYEDFSPAPPITGQFTYPELALGPLASEAFDSSRSATPIIESSPGGTGNLWYGPYVGVPAGEYDVSVDLRVWTEAANVSRSTAQPVLQITISGYPPSPLYYENLTQGELGGGSWITLTFSVVFGAPTPRVEVRGYQLSPDIGLQLADVIIAPPP